MKLKLICCDVFMREACAAIVKSKHTVNPEFTPKGAHDEPGSLRDLIQSKIDSVEEKDGFDAIVLGYGLCGNGTAGLKARSIPLVLPRAHDCCTIFLGSKERFMENFKDNLSARWSSAGYMERGDSYLRDSDMDKLLGRDKEYEEYVKLYGEENAQFIWETLHPKNNQDEYIYINTPESEHLDSLDRFRAKAEKNGKTVRVLQGDSKLLSGLLNGEWNADEYLVVPPGGTIKAVYDHDKVVVSE